MRAAWGVFLILFLGSAWFHQGGGWNQNVRFAQIRAIAESGRLFVDDYVFYLLERSEDGDVDYRRVRLSDPGTRLARLPQANGFDLSVRDGHFYPAKAPGVSLLGSPAYFGVYRVGRLLGVNPDSWWPFTLGLYLTTLLTVGLLGAVGGAVFLWVARSVLPEAPDGARVAAALTLGLGTLWLPYSTVLFEHVPAGTISLVALGSIHAGRRAEPGGVRRARLQLFAAGTACGLLVLLNYGLVLLVSCLTLYAASVCRPRARVAWLLAGGVLPALALTAYHQACFGAPFATARDHQLEIFTTPGALLGVLGSPRADVLFEVLFGSYRGLLFYSPVLALALYGAYTMARQRSNRAEGLLVLGVTAVYLALVSALNGWHGGSAIGPRYLMPAVPFLALALVPCFARLTWVTWPLAAVSAAIMLLVTAVDPMVEVEIRRPLSEYYVPMARGDTLDVAGWSMRGPVSAQTLGAAGGSIEITDPRTPIARWNAFNLGEFWLGHGWGSVAPLLMGWAAIALLCFRGTSRPGSGVPAHAPARGTSAGAASPGSRSHSAAAAQARKTRPARLRPA
ncbi:MAG: hypothetical protein QNK04_28900 [Myxococcota bacterium]|nr:hypothetical protein [Myxococcota bacterium]